ncbi:MAG: 16S rRNA (cytidine(1402)-2'-O)-methyltransferase [Anaerolineaceae bacterium]|nr:16S rRNA (cytidine(1402)-2'-O)-methyltransferase [Anaerolineaceae bacterium]
MSTLYLVATPIGNLEDISARALRVLSQVGLIAAEDTRHTRKLLSAYDIHTPLTSYHEHNKIARLAPVLDALQRGPVALVSDAGTPALNDPGYELVQAALAAGHAVSPIPGPCAPVAALVASGLPTDEFLFLGYLPRRSSERRALLRSIAALPYTVVFLETPHRLLDGLSDLLQELGDRPVAAARELTKLHEEFIRGNLSAVLEHFRRVEPRGEFTLIVGGNLIPDEPWSEERLLSALESGIQSGESSKGLTQRLADESGWPRREIYQKIVDRRDSRPKEGYPSQ